MAETSQSWYAHGKLLLTGEYAVLEGALALAVPTKRGQRLTVQQSPARQRRIEWKSYQPDGTCWLEVWLDKNGSVLSATDHEAAMRLRQLLFTAMEHNPDFMLEDAHYEVTTHLEFDRSWGLGSSSTLVSNVARWAEVDPYELLAQTFGGSGYDIACATASGPLTYRLDQTKPVVESVSFFPSFSDQLFFYYLGKKQNSAREVSRYRELTFDRQPWAQRVSELTHQLVLCDSFTTFSALLEEHEALIQSVLKVPTAKEAYLPSFAGSVKSLGAWGGDFVLLAVPEGEKVPNGAIPYLEMVLA